MPARPMRWTVAPLILLAAATTAAGPLTDRSSDDDVLDAMHDRGHDLKSFTADMKQDQVDGLGQSVTFRGTVKYEALAGGDARLHVTLDTKQKGEGPVQPNKREYLLEKGMLTDRDFTSKTEAHRKLVADGQSVDLFALGKGPFPLPIGQDRAKVRQLFDVTRPAPDKDAPPDPPHAIHLRLTPRAGTELARQFKTIDFWVDVQQQMPVRIETVDAKGAMDQTTDLANLHVNPGVTDADFTLAPTGPGWRVGD